MKQATGITVLVLIAVAGWKIGEGMTHGELHMALGIIFGVFIVGMPATLIAVAAPRQRVDVYHHTVTDTPQPTVTPTALTVQPEKWFVVEPTVMILPTATHGRLEVKR